MTSTQIETEAVREMAHGVPSVSVEELEADPHGVFRRYRANTPLIERQGAFVVLRAMDVERLFKDPRLGQPRTEFLNRLGITEGALFDLFALSMVGADEETHARLRAPLTRTFAARVIRAMRPIIRARAEALIDALGNARAFDLIAQFSSFNSCNDDCRHTGTS
ncbi:cytochrome P450 [Bradyrhizobium japonicum]